MRSRGGGGGTVVPSVRARPRGPRRPDSFSAARWSLSRMVLISRCKFWIVRFSSSTRLPSFARQSSCSVFGRRMTCCRVLDFLSSCDVLRDSNQNSPPPRTSTTANKPRRTLAKERV